ncbi:MAG TPA: biopolymer transporter TolR [Prolixibacteraceae bacterium]
MKKIVSLLFLTVLISVNLNAQMSGAKIGSFDNFCDIGAPEIPGTANFGEPSQVYYLSGSGSNIWFGMDSFSFLTRKMNGDFILQTRVRFIGEGHELHRKSGLMIRKSTASNSPVVACTVHGDGLTSLQYRVAPGDTMKEIKFTIKGPDVLQLEKKGNTYTMSVAHFGEVYQSEKIENLDLGADLLAGLFVCSHNNKFSEAVEFRNSRVFNTVPDDMVQYKSYLGSLLEVMDITTGQRQVLASAAGSWQAPNWTPDGKTLIYNTSGKLYNFDLNTRESTVLNTDFVNKNNNDHVLTFDGKQMGLSSSADENKGQSVVYTVPVTGGIPKKITTNSPSYFHGWSPDSQFLVFTGERNGDFDIYKISKDGGKEIRLTEAKGLDDGCEFSPDGKYIYFCSTRTGNMQVWRMDPDGKNQTQLTFDGMNNWFPHVSPDNKWLVFITFSKEVPANQHPFYKRVYLRIMPVNGGEIRTIAYLYGGQGTINVPSWSPDSKKIAFVSNGNF